MQPDLCHMWAAAHAELGLISSTPMLWIGGLLNSLLLFLAWWQAQQPPHQERSRRGHSPTGVEMDENKVFAADFVLWSVLFQREWLDNWHFRMGGVEIQFFHAVCMLQLGRDGIGWNPDFHGHSEALTLILVNANFHCWIYKPFVMNLWNRVL